MYMPRSEKDQYQNAIRLRFKAWAAAHVHIAKESGKTRGIKNTKLNFNEMPGCRIIPSPISPELDSVELNLPDPVAFLSLDNMDQHDPLFRIINGITLHEVAHLIFGTPNAMQSLPKDKYLRIAFNALLDVCDEYTLKNHIIEGSHALLRDTAIRIATTVVLPNIQSEPPSMQVCKIALIRMLSGDTTPYEQHTFIHGKGTAVIEYGNLNQYANEIDSIQRIMKLGIQECRNQVMFNMNYSIQQSLDRDMPRRVEIKELSARSEQCWKRLLMIARDITHIMKKLDEEQDNNKDKAQPNKGSGNTRHDLKLPNQQDKNENQDQQEQDQDQNQDQNQDQDQNQSDENTDGKDNKTRMKSATDDILQDAYDKMLSNMKQEKVKNTAAKQRPGAGATNNIWIKKNKKTFNRYRSLMRRLMSQLLRSRRLALCKPSLTGSWTRDVQRAYTDGRIFIKRDDMITENATVALVLDCSGSTQGYVDKLAAFMGCLAEGVIEAGSTCAVWFFGSEAIPVPVSKLFTDHPPDLGGTIISTPLEEAIDWLADCEDENAKRICIILTDGQPNSEDWKRIVAQGERAYDENIQMIVGSLKNVDITELVKALPYSIPFSVNNNMAVSALSLAKKIRMVVSPTIVK